MDTNAFPIPVARLIIKNANDQVLILRRAGSAHATGSWCLPGGKIDYGDTVKEAATRELNEETGLVCTEAKFLFYQDSLPPKPGTMHCINLYFECTVSGNVALNNESSEFAWISSEDIDQYDIAFRNDLGLLRYWKENADLLPGNG
jgi:mutator protein MutT